MAIQRVLALIAGKLQEYIAKDVSGGAGDAGNLVALNSVGRVDLSMMPAGIGPATRTMPASEALSAGAWINIYSNAGVVSARNSDGTTTGKQIDGFVLSAVASAGTATVYLAGINNATSGQTIGALVFLSDVAVGSTMATGATTAGHVYQQVGIALSATEVQFDPQAPITRA